MRDANGMAQDSHLYVAVVIGIDAANERDPRAALGALMRPFGVYRLSDQVDGHWSFPHLKCAIICGRPGRFNDALTSHARQHLSVGQIATDARRQFNRDVRAHRRRWHRASPSPSPVLSPWVRARAPGSPAPAPEGSAGW